MKRHPFSAILSGLRAISGRLCAGLLACAFLPLPLTSAALPGSDAVSVPELYYRCPETARESVFAAKNVLIIVPHEDDEVCLSGGVIEEYLQCGSTVRVLFVTNGDYQGLGETRLREAIAALAVCGLPEENIIFLGYGDQWQTSHRSNHIYVAPGGAVMTSYIGRTRTYGLPDHPPYESHAYTRNNLVSDLTSVLTEFRPDTIFCIDFDGHRDHRATSLLFEECMASILKAEPGYTPDVYKGFGYGMGWEGVNDFYAENIRSACNPSGSAAYKDNPCYQWDDRIRFPVSIASLGRIKAHSSVYRMLVCHASQLASEKAGRIINGDRAYWYRPTTSVLYGAQVTATSGDAARLTDFKLLDYKNVCTRTSVFDNYLWAPAANDAEREITFTFDEPKDLSEIRLYGNAVQPGQISATITFSDGAVIETGQFTAGGTPYIVSFEKKYALTGFTVKLPNDGGRRPCLSEIEAYTDPPSDGALSLIKLMNSAGDFCYDYWIAPEGTETLYLYGAQTESGSLADGYTLTVSEGSGCSAAFEGDGVVVTCPAGASFLLTVESTADPSLTDTIRISNPTAARRWLVALYQKEEKETVSST